VTSLQLKIENILDLKLEFNLWILLGIVQAVAAFFVVRYLVRKGKLSRTIEFDGSEIGIGPHKIKLKANAEDLRICYNLWVEMSTRKIGLPIDIERDVISEVYNSWYSFFGIARDLIKSIPVTKILQNGSTSELVRISIEMLNKGLRPHLTTWQAKFRKWYDEKIKSSDNAEKSPQDVQKHFPQYEELAKDLLYVNTLLVAYKDKLAGLLQ